MKIIEESIFPDYRYELTYKIIKQDNNQYTVNFLFYGPLLDLNNDEWREIMDTIGVELIEWIEFSKIARVKLIFPEPVYTQK